MFQPMENILSVELLSAAQAFDFRRPLKSSKILEECHHYVRKIIDHADEDRIFANDLKSANNIIVSGKLVEISNEVSKANKINLYGGYDELFGLY